MEPDYRPPRILLGWSEAMSRGDRPPLGQCVAGETPSYGPPRLLNKRGHVLRVDVMAALMKGQGIFSSGRKNAGDAGVGARWGHEMAKART